MGLPGSKHSPVHMGGGFKVENLDAFSMTIVALVLGLIRWVNMSEIVHEFISVFSLVCVAAWL
jgi:hypothetical protein